MTLTFYSIKCDARMAFTFEFFYYFKYPLSCLYVTIHLYELLHQEDCRCLLGLLARERISLKKPS